MLLTPSHIVLLFERVVLRAPSALKFAANNEDSVQGALRRERSN